MNIETTKLELMHLLLQTQEESLLAKIKKVFDEEKNDWWDTMDEEEQKEIQKGIEQADQGQFVTHEKVMNRFGKWH